MRTGILMMNTGSPSEPSIEAIRRFLEEMLSDPMLISAPPFIWRQVLNRAILPNRPVKTQPEYQAIWTPQGSPIIVTSRKQCELLQREMDARAPELEPLVVLAMRYGEPSIMDGLRRMRDEGIERVVLLPLYPQEVRVCAGTCLKRAGECLDELAKEGWKPQVREVRSFYRQQAYRDALYDSVARYWNSKNRPSGDVKLIISFHSTLMKDILDGDPYKHQTEATGAELATRLGIPVDDYQVTYQSRFDDRKWLQPFTEHSLYEWGREARENGRPLHVLAVCPGFVCDNLETKVEISVRAKRFFLTEAPKGSSFTYVPALNDDPGLVAALANAVMAVLG